MTQRITIGPSLVAITVPDPLKDVAETWLNSFVTGGLTFVARLASPANPGVVVAWLAGLQVSDEVMAQLSAGADLRGVGYLVLERYEGIDTDRVEDMTLKRVTNRTAFLQALGLIPWEPPE